MARILACGKSLFSFADVLAVGAKFIAIGAPSTQCAPGSGIQTTKMIQKLTTCCPARALALPVFGVSLAFSTPAHAEAALGELVFMLPKLLLMGVYYEVAQPATLAIIWSATALAWMLYLLTGRDLVDEWLSRLPTEDETRHWMSIHAFCTLVAIGSLVITLLGYALWGPPPKPSARMPTHAATPTKTERRQVQHTLPYPYGKSPSNPQGRWPTSTGSLPDQPWAAMGGAGLMLLRNPTPEGLWVRLCTAGAQPCDLLRQIYLAPQSGDTLERVAPGAYTVEYTETSGAQRSGRSQPFKVGNNPIDNPTLVLSEFQQP